MQQSYWTFNCTLWNWNIQEGAKGVFALMLLIVPYGIETACRRGRAKPPLYTFNCTLWNWNSGARRNTSRADFLLIVPYGIETNSGGFRTSWYGAFNCTLWNWNDWKQICCWGFDRLLIVPYGIETQHLLSNPIALQNF